MIYINLRKGGVSPSETDVNFLEYLRNKSYTISSVRQKTSHVSAISFVIYCGYSCLFPYMKITHYLKTAIILEENITVHCCVWHGRAKKYFELSVSIIIA